MPTLYAHHMAEGGGERASQVRTDHPGLTAEDVAGSFAARQALGPDAEEAVIQAFLERTGQAIDARVEERLAERQLAARPPTPSAPHPPHQGVDRTPLALAIVSLGAGIPLTGIATQFQNSGLIAVVVIWAAIALINVVYGRRRS